LLIIPEGDRRKKEEAESASSADRGGGRPPRQSRPNPQRAPEGGD
jgi:hypothetical protein